MKKKNKKQYLPNRNKKLFEAPVCRAIITFSFKNLIKVVRNCSCVLKLGGALIYSRPHSTFFAIVACIVVGTLDDYCCIARKPYPVHNDSTENDGSNELNITNTRWPRVTGLGWNKGAVFPRHYLCTVY